MALPLGELLLLDLEPPVLVRLLLAEEVLSSRLGLRSQRVADAALHHGPLLHGGIFARQPVLLGDVPRRGVVQGGCVGAPSTVVAVIAAIAAITAAKTAPRPHLPPSLRGRRKEQNRRQNPQQICPPHH